MQGQLRDLIQRSCEEWIHFFQHFSLASVEMKETLHVYRRRSLVNMEQVEAATAATASTAGDVDGVTNANAASSAAAPAGEVKRTESMGVPAAGSIAAHVLAPELQIEEQEGSTILHEILIDNDEATKKIFTAQKDANKRVIQSSWDKPMSWYPPLFQIKLIPEKADTGFILRFDPPLDLFKKTCVGVLDEMAKALGEMETIDHEMLPLLMLEPRKLYPLMQEKQICAESDQCIEDARVRVTVRGGREFTFFLKYASRASTQILTKRHETMQELIESEIKALKALARLYEEFIPLLSLSEDAIVEAIKINELGRRVPIEGSVRPFLPSLPVLLASSLRLERATDALSK